jgi:glucose-1-phosphate cytidylyltransferase
MKVVILAGGLGSRISEESDVRPKPMIEIGGMPILWHIMKIYSHHGLNDFVICLGYKGYVIKEYFANYFLHMSDVTIDLATNRIEVERKRAEGWRVSLVDTGLNTQTGGRLKRIRRYVEDGDFCMTYGDGVTDLDIGRLIAFHRAHGKLATVTAVSPPGRYGALRIEEGGGVSEFMEKPRGDGGLISGGFFVLSPKVLDYIDEDETAWEEAPVTRIAKAGQMMAFRHDGFWHAMDTLRDKRHLDNLLRIDRAPWKTWG